jgi:AraC-like DNA-binding protein
MKKGMNNNKCSIMVDDYKIRHLKTQSFLEWVRFFKNEVFRCKITPINAIFYGEVKVINYNNGFKFISINAVSQQMCCNDLFDFICVIFSKGKFSWEQGNSLGELPFGGFVVLDGNESIRYKNSSDNEVIVFLIPSFYFKLCNIKDMHLTVNSLYNDCVYALIENILFCENSIFLKMQAIVNLLVLIYSEHEKMKIENKVGQNVIDFIRYNALNNWLNMEFISTSLCMSKSKIHKLLKVNGLSYSYLVKKFRITELARKINTEKGKTLTQMCYECGFNSISNANVQFKAVNKMSISEYKDSVNR